jgi:predicted dithiol-disulfide oxidoreductase (DUF899 family)
MKDQTLEPVSALATRNTTRHPGESAAYREARQRLLEHEYEVRRMIEAVAAERRALPEGAEVREYRFQSPDGEVTLEHLFGAHDTLIAYSYMFGPERRRPCPMCTSFMAATAPRVKSIEKNCAIVFIARSPLPRLLEEARALGFPDLPVVSDVSGAYTRDWVSAEDADIPALNVFTRREGLVRHFWSGETGEADTGQDPRGAPEVDPLWTFLDLTPAGRRPDWYPSLEEFGPPSR